MVSRRVIYLRSSRCCFNWRLQCKYAGISTPTYGPYETILAVWVALKQELSVFRGLYRSILAVTGVHLSVTGLQNHHQDNFFLLRTATYPASSTNSTASTTSAKAKSDPSLGKSSPAPYTSSSSQQSCPRGFYACTER